MIIEAIREKQINFKRANEKVHFYVEVTGQYELHSALLYKKKIDAV